MHSYRNTVTQRVQQFVSAETRARACREQYRCNLQYPATSLTYNDHGEPLNWNRIRPPTELDDSTLRPYAQTLCQSEISVQ